jgi:hypothetical protein
MDKEWWKSTTIWGLIIGFVGFVLSQIYGFALITSDEGTTLVNNIVQLVASGMAIWGVVQGIIGRIRAGREIKTLRFEVKKLNARP